MRDNQLLKKLLREFEINNKELKASYDDYKQENVALHQKIKALQSEIENLKSAPIQEEDNRYLSLFENLHIPVTLLRLTFDDDGQPEDFEHIEVNQEYADWVNMPKDVCIGKKASEIYDDYREELDWFPRMIEVITTGQPQLIKRYSKLISKWLEINMYSPDTNEVVMLIKDVTAREHAKSEHLLANTRLNLALRMEKIAVWEWVVPLDVVENYNEYWNDLYQFDNKDILKQFYERIFEEDTEPSRKALEEHLAGHTEDFHQLFRLRNKHGGGFKWIKNTGKVIERDEEGNPMRMVGVSREVTEQRLAELDLQLANTRLSMSLEMDNLAIWEGDIEGDKALNYNEHWKSVFELDPEGIAAQFDVRTPKEDKAEVWAVINKGVQSDDPYTYEYRMWNKNFTAIKWIRNTGKVIARNEKGEPVRVLGISKDITFEKERQIQLERSAFEQKYAQELAKMGNWYYNVESQEVEWTDELYRIFGLNPRVSEVPYLDQEKYYTDESWEQLTKAVEQALKEGASYDLELEVIPADQKESRWLRSIGEPVMNTENKVIALRGVAQDITEIKEVNQRLATEKRFAETIMASSAAGMYIFNLQEQKNVYANKRTSEILGFSLEELREMPSKIFMSHFHEEDLPEVFDHFEKMNTTSEPVKIKYRFKHKDGHYVTCIGVDAPYEFDKAGKLKSYIGSFIDVSELYQKEEELIRARNEAISANKQKDLFLANLSHEIRTPMNAVVGFSKLLRKSGKKKAEKDLYLEQIEANSRQLLVLVDEILDLSKIETGRLQLNVESCSVRKLAEEAFSYYSDGMQKVEQGKPLQILFKPPRLQKGRDMIITDPVRLRQVITNLMDNAIKYSEEGSITLSYKYLKNGIQFSVKDEGMGIPPTKLQAIFERFEQLSDVDQPTEGAGLGLSIVKGILTAMNGTINVKSKEGEGSTFTFMIPGNYTQLVREEEPERDPSTKSKMAIQKILLADDTTAIHLYVDSLLSDVDVEVLHAYDGKDAVEKFQEHSDIGLVLLDLKMPVMNGEEAFYAIRKLDADVPIVAQSAFAMNNEIRRYKELGFTDYLTKPMEEEKILALLQT